MKKLFTIFTLASLLFTACNPANDFGIKPEDSKLVYPQEAQKIVPENFILAAVQSIDLGSYVGETVKIAVINKPDLDGGVLSNLKATLVPDSDPDKSAELDITDEGFVTVAALQQAIETLYNKRPLERSFTLGVKGDVLQDQTCFCIASSNEVTLAVTPNAPELSDNYYIVGGPLDWAGSCQTKELKFDHSGKDVYEDPFFSITFPAAASGDTWFAIGDDKGCDAVANDNNWGLLFGTTGGNGNSGESGLFDRRTNLSDDGSFKVAEGCKFIRVTLDVMAGTYTVTPIVADKYYVIGGALDWVTSCQTKEQQFKHSDKSVGEDPIFTITIPAAASGDTWFAIGDDTSCDSVAVANNWSYVYGTTSGNGNSGESGIIDRRKNLLDDGSFKVEAGCSYIFIELNGLTFTYKVKALNFAEYIYEIGNESGWGTSHPLYGADFDGKYQGFYYLDGEFKFKPNKDNWDGDWEQDGIYDSTKPWSYRMVENGSNNFPAPYDGAGFYQIDVDLSIMEASITKVGNISLIGAFTSWSSDVDMTYDTTEGCWKATNVNITESGVKVRLNHDWAVSWGGRTSGTDYNDLTKYNGQNLDVSPGTYTVKFYLTCEQNHKIEFITEN